MAAMTNDQAKALRAPFPREAIGHQDRGGGTRLAYVGHAATTARLLEVDPTWSWEPLSVDERGLPAFDHLGGLWIRLTVCGVTRIGYGDAQGKKGPNAVKEAIGDAIRNAAMRFGVAIDLWAKEDISATLPPETAGGAGTGGEDPPAPSVNPYRGNRDSNDPASSHERLWGALQAGLAEWQKANDASRADVLLLVSSVVDREVASTKELTVNEARAVLDRLKVTQRLESFASRAAAT